MKRGAVPGAFGLLALAGLLAGPVAFAVVVLVMALGTLLDLSAVLRRAGASPIVPAALIPGLGLPVRVALGEEAGWESVSEFVAVGFFAAAFLALLFGRRSRVTEGLGATLLSGLVVGVGAGTLLLLRELAGGFRWTLGLVLLVTAAALSAPLARAIGPAALLPGTAAMAVIAALTLAPPFDLAFAAVFAGIALLGVLAAQEWRLAPAGLLLAAPLAYLVARTAAV